MTSSTRHMSRLTIAVATLVALPALPAEAGQKAKQIEFGIKSTRAKIDSGTQGGWIPMYGPGDNLIIEGGSIHAVYTGQTADGVVEIRLCSSDDGGLSWGETSVIARSPDFDGNGAAVATGPDPTTPGRTLFHVVWADRAARQIVYARGYMTGSPWFPWTWSTPVSVSGTASAAGETRSVAADAHGGVHVAFAGYLSGVGGGVFYSRSLDAGQTFIETAQAVAMEQSDEPDIAADALGNVFIAWKGPWVGPPLGSQVRFSKRPIGDTSFVTPVTVNTAYAGHFGSLAIIDQYDMCIAWAYGGVAIACTTNGGSSWTEYLVTTDSADLTHLAVDGNGVWNLTWLGYQPGAEGIQFSRSTTGVSKWLSPSLVDAIGDYSPKIAVDTAGLAHIAYPNYQWTVVYFSKEKK